MKTDGLEAIGRVLREEDGFLIAGHVRPDGDSLASGLFLAGLLRRLGKRAVFGVAEKAPDERYAFLEGFEDILGMDALARRREGFPWAVIVDCPTVDRIGSVARFLPDPERILNIDHHESNESFGALNEVRAKASSTCEILADLVPLLGVPWDPALAAAIYAGIAFDTGRFRFGNTSHHTLRVASEMVRHGARAEVIARRLFYRRSPRSLELLARALAGIRYHLDGRVASMAMEENLYALPDAPWRDLDGFVDYPMSVAGVEAALFLKRCGPDRFRVSLRSRGGINVSDVALCFGGGGHAQAAGCHVSGDRDQVERKLLEAMAPSPQG